MKYVVHVTAADRRVAARLVRVKSMPGKGSGVVAARDIPASTFVAPYPGTLYTLREYEKVQEAGGTDGKFVVDFYKPDVNGFPRSGYVLDPGAAGGVLHPDHKGAIAPLLNEPGEAHAPNMLWVWNLPKYRMEVWTRVPVRAGEELTLCYGLGGGYQRGYRTSCVSRPGEVEPQLHVITRPGGKPLPYSLLGNSGVRDAIRRNSTPAARCKAGKGSAASCTSGTLCVRRGRSRCTRRT